MMQQRSQDTHDRIITAAVREFGTHGYDNTSVSQICKAADVSKGAFYHHFPSKQAIFLELLDTWLNQIDASFLYIRNQSDTVPEALLMMTGMMGSIYDAAGGNLPMFLEFWNQARHDQEIWDEVIDPYRRYQDYFADMIQEGIAEGSLKDVDPQKTARVMVAMAVGLLLQGVLDPNETNWQQVTQYGFQMLLNDILYVD